MFLTRQKILVTYIYLLGKKCSRLHLIKALFLFCKENENEIYDFHPYLRGPFSELIFLDLRKLDEKGIIKNGENSLEVIDIEAIKSVLVKLPSEYIYHIQNTIDKYGELSDKELMNFVYKAYPYFAINNPTKLGKFNKYDPRKKEENKNAKLFSIGYEGITIDTYIDKLILNNITLLLDVRKNPQSMKYGFTKSRLREILTKRGIKYVHIPELGINGEERQELNSYNDYLELFSKYRVNLPHKEEYIEQIISYLDDGERVALTCFEADCKCCHRNEVTKYLSPMINGKYELKHI
ncbi:DUF488 domain-containing protein [Candidatus Gracilibacteria bacterium]|nr:DUF488 domain-containing protein [Candidatus Gracilibacteria bacterium]